MTVYTEAGSRTTWSLSWEIPMRQRPTRLSMSAGRRQLSSEGAKPFTPIVPAWIMRW